MDLELHVTKQYGLKYKSKGRYIKFAVVDLDKNLNYPKNFLCLLPTRINPKLQNKSKFFDLFGSQSLQIAQILLEKTLENENDVEIVNEIRRRLKKIELLLTLKLQCRLCGELFNDMQYFRQSKICIKCKHKSYAKY